MHSGRTLVLEPFRRDAPPELLPALVLIENSRGYSRTNMLTLPEQRGYTAFARSRHDVALRRPEDRTWQMP